VQRENHPWGGGWPSDVIPFFLDRFNIGMILLGIIISVSFWVWSILLLKNYAGKCK